MKQAGAAVLRRFCGPRAGLSSDFERFYGFGAGLNSDFDRFCGFGAGLNIDFERSEAPSAVNSGVLSVQRRQVR